MTLWLPLLAFAFGSLLVTAVTYALTTRTANIDDRLRDVLGHQPQAQDADASSEQVVAFLKRVGERLPKSPKDLGKIQLRLVQAGHRNAEALPVFLAIRVGFALAAFAFCMTPLLVKPNLLMALSAAGFGYVLPGMLLARKARRRQHRIRLSLADALDLLVVSVEAGLGLDQALARVGQELAFAYPDLSSELRLVNLELLAGKGGPRLCATSRIEPASTTSALSSPCWSRPTSSARASRTHCVSSPTRCARSAASAQKKRRRKPA